MYAIIQISYIIQFRYVKKNELGLLLLGFLLFYQSGCLPKVCATYESNYLVVANRSKLQVPHSRQDDIFFSYLSQTDSLPRRDTFFKSKALKHNGLVKRRTNVAGLFLDRYSDYQGNRRKIMRAYPRYPVPLATIDSTESTDALLSEEELALLPEDSTETLGEEQLVEMSINEQYPTIFNPPGILRDSLVFAQKNMEQAMYEIRFSNELTNFLHAKYGKPIEPEVADTAQTLTDSTVVKKGCFLTRLFKRKSKTEDDETEMEKDDGEEDDELMDDEG